MTIFGNKICTRRLLLRKIEEKNLAKIVEWSHSEEAYGEYLTPECISHEDGSRHLETGLFWNDKSRTFIIELHDGTPIGTIHYWLRSENKAIAVVALKIARLDLRKQGYGTEAQKYLIIQLFERAGLDAVEMYTDIDNHAQQRCLRKLGFALIDSLQYEDQDVKRTGHLFRLTSEAYKNVPLYQYHYE